MRSLVTNLVFIFVFVFVLSPDLQAQRRRNSRQLFRVYPSVGATASQIRGDELRGFKKWGVTAGVGAIMSISDDNTWDASIEANFSQRGAYNNTNDPYSLIGFTLNYVDIPLTIHFTDPWGGITIGAGLNYSRLVQQPHGSIYYSPDYFIPDTGDMSFLKNDFAFALDMRFPIWRGLTFNLRFQHSLLPIKKNWGFTEYPTVGPGVNKWTNNLYNSSVSVRLLYVFGDDNSRYNKYNRKSPNKNHKKRRR